MGPLREYLSRDAICLRVRFRGKLNGLRITATHGDHNRNAFRLRDCEDQLIAMREVFIRESEAAKAVCAQGVHTGLKQDQLRCELLHLFQPGFECWEVLSRRGIVGKSDIESAALFAEREIVRSVNGEREYLIVVLEDARRPISLVNVQVDDRDALDSGALQSPFG